MPRITLQRFIAIVIFLLLIYWALSLGVDERGNFRFVQTPTAQVR